MIRSMTGYGRKEVATEGIHITIEIRSVNNRFMDIQVKTPRTLAPLDPRIKKTVQERFSRGRFDLFIVRNGDRESAGRLSVDEQLLGQYIAVMKSIKERFNLEGDVNLGLIAGFPGMIGVSEEKEDIEKVWPALSDGLRLALDELDQMRTEEGRALAADMNRRIDAIEALTQAVSTLAPSTVEHARKKMSETLSRLMNEQPDPVRLAQEIAILAERTDVTEELTRLSSHIHQFRGLMSDAGSEPIGRKLDFLLQEMGREANTIASKAMNSQIAYRVVDIKAELEKIREQVQNIE